MPYRVTPKRAASRLRRNLRRNLCKNTFAWLLLLGLSALLSSCELSSPQSFMETAGPVARSQVELFEFTFWLATGVFGVVTAALIYAIWRYRRRDSQEGLPPQVHGAMGLEIAWTLAPAVVLVILGIPTVNVIFQNQTHSSEEEALSNDDLLVNVTGYQWWWEFEYPELGITTANELHIPTGRRVVLNLNSGDVLHSFWVPKLAGKRDLIPNQDNQLWLQADEPGMYYGQCAELCLTAHAYMRFRVIASDEQGFDTWVAAFNEDAQRVAAQPQPFAEGEALFKTKGCANCHAVSGYAMGQGAPDLTNFGMRHTLAAGVLDNTPENLAAWLADPQAVKPGNYMPTLWAADDPERDTQIAAIVAYLQSLGGETAPLARR